MDYMEIATQYVWLFFVLATFSYFVGGKFSRVFRFAQVSALGVQIGAICVQAVNSISRVAVTPIMKGDLMWVVPILLGLLLFTRFSKTHAPYSRIPMALAVSVALLVALKGYTTTHLGPALQQFTVKVIGGSITPLDNLVTLFFAVVSIFYFLYIREPKGSFAQVARLSKYALVICLAVMAATTITARISWFIAVIRIIVRMFVPAPV